MQKSSLNLNYQKINLVTPIKALIIDDERLAREEIKTLLAKWDEIEILAEAENAIEAIKLIEHTHVDLLFLDIHMPQKNGFELLEELDYAPTVIFVTAYDEYAIQAFEVNALDYIVKPICSERFDKCVQRAITQLRTFHKEKSSKHQIFVKDGKKCHFIKLTQIAYIKSIGNYAQLHFDNQTAMVKRPLNYLEETLPSYFFRCNRSEIINHNFIEEINPLSKSALQIKLSTNQTINLSDRKSVLFKQKLKL